MQWPYSAPGLKGQWEFECGLRRGWWDRWMDGGRLDGWGDLKNCASWGSEPTSGSAQSCFGHRPGPVRWHRWSQSHCWLPVGPQIIKNPARREAGSLYIFKLELEPTEWLASASPQIVCWPGWNTVCKYLCRFCQARQMVGKCYIWEWVQR